MRKIDRMPELPEVTRYTKYYEHDGMLRAYANRAMLLAMIFGVLAMGSLGFAMYVRIQPPTVIRVDKDGNALVVGGPRGGNVAAISLSADASSADAFAGVAGNDVGGLGNHLVFDGVALKLDALAALPRRPRRCVLARSAME